MEAQLEGGGSYTYTTSSVSMALKLSQRERQNVGHVTPKSSVHFALLIFNVIQWPVSYCRRPERARRGLVVLCIFAIFQSSAGQFCIIAIFFRSSPF